MRIRNQRGVMMPSPVVMLSVVAVAMAGIAFVATRGGDPTVREGTPVARHADPGEPRAPRAKTGVPRRPAAPPADPGESPSPTFKPSKKPDKPEPPKVQRGRVYVEV